MRANKLIIFTALFVLGLFLFWGLDRVLAQTGSSGPGGTNPPAAVPSNLPGLINGGVRTDFISFLKWFYPFLLSAAAVLAVLMIVVSGVQWAGSMGSEQAIKNAKDRLTNAIFGLILAFAAWLILNTINPDLIKLRVETKSINQIAVIR